MFFTWLIAAGQYHNAERYDNAESFAIKKTQNPEVLRFYRVYDQALDLM